MNLAVLLSALLGLTTEIAHHARPIGDPSQWIRTEDYPMAAMAAGSTGVTGVELGIDATGRVERCSIVSSSGSTLLDGMTCGLLTARARYRPATDANGQTVSDIASQKVRWQLPETDTLAPVDFHPFNLMVGFEISENGRIENCAVIIRPEAMPMGDPCAANAERRFNPILGKDGKVIRQKVFYRMSMQPQ